jgi:site-specific DNA-methyltransferase (adenine-specific)
MKTHTEIVSRKFLSPHPFHEEVYESDVSDSLEESFVRTENVPVYPILVVPVPNLLGWFWVVSGMNRLLTLIKMGKKDIEVLVYETTDEKEIKNLIIDLNKQRFKSGRELLREFRHYLSMYPEQRGVPGNRYSKIGKELGRSKDWVKNMVILNNLFEGEGDIILEKIFGKELSVSEGFQIKKVVEKFEDKFATEGSLEKICDPKFDYKRLEYGLSNLSIDDDHDYELLRTYLLKDLTTQEFYKKLQQMGRVRKIVNDHESNKVNVPMFEDVFTSENTHLIHGNSFEVEFKHPFEKQIRCLVGSAEYGNRRLNRESTETSPGHHMNGQEYGMFLAGVYVRYKKFIAPDGSVYVILDDYRHEDGALSCYLEYFVTEMLKNGFYLVGRYIWVKENPMPRSYRDKDMVNGYEMVYRFSLNPKNYYCNPNVFIELEKGEHEGFQEGCTNSDGKGNTSRGSDYYQSHLKKLRNTLDERNCKDIIRGNVCNPEDFFREEKEKRHTSQSPIYLTSTLILESTRPEDLVVDIWNGVGNTMTSALLLGRKYVGIELNKEYYDQTCRRIQMTEEMLKRKDNDLPMAA